MWEAIALGAALAMDAVAVSIVRGVQNRATHSGGRDALVLPLLFALFQAGMAALGWFVGEAGGAYVEAYDHWIAFGLLLLLGGKMVHGVWIAPKSDDEAPARAGLGVDIGLAVATSIDAAAAGITLSIVPVSPGVAIALIGIVTLVACAIGYAVGRAVGHRIGVRLEGIGGLLLMAIGVRVLVQHL